MLVLQEFDHIIGNVAHVKSTRAVVGGRLVGV
jgi:hypothetical protein